ncbi:MULTISPECIES: hypothetical protein [unclassified Rhizobacter]|uniref:hypothetical protein n=1 Tax=unclassified Rhizobacter TaxID=2640088 RepID=UPI0006F25931|nr:MULTISPECIES: hypothetical protein [unclassified Rhizobacter]KQU77839.1 hypothetical protein ASC88_18430 [Rhizobacter sp. Root29]KQW10274.1 hypothetical protein ASC98_23035 [Rhizobacter sp. Root1238]KRB20264.1 hypothetical protein ASE08_22870 [Rhizobacter sp. Root16D2]
MNRSTATASAPINFRALPANEGIEWEDMPSLPVSRSKGPQAEDGPAWKNTMPASMMDVAQPPKPFREALDGLSMREVDEPEIFQHFFGK